MAGFHAGGPAAGFLAAYATHLTTRIAMIGITILLATAIGESAEGAIGLMESALRDYDNSTGNAYGRSAAEMRDALKKNEHLIERIGIYTSNVTNAVLKTPSSMTGRVERGMLIGEVASGGLIAP